MNKINVVYACDEQAIKLCTVSMLSCLYNKGIDDYINFFIIIDEKFSRDTFPEFAPLYTDSSTVSVLKVNSKDFELYKKTTKRTDLPINTYYWLDIPWLLPSEERAIFLDFDTVIIKSLWHIYSMNMEGYYLAAVEDAWLYYRADQMSKYQNRSRHYNSGVVVLNMPMWREKSIRQKLTDFSRKYEKVLILADEGLINSVVNDNVIFLDYTWNMQIPRPGIDRPVEYNDMTAYERAKSNPSIVHYNFRKPWQLHLCINPYSDIWWFYARKLPFYEDLLLTSVQNSITVGKPN